MHVPGPSWDAVLRAPLNAQTLTAASSLVAAAMRPRLRAARKTGAPAADLHALFQASPSVLCLLEASGRVRAITPNAARVLGDACDRAAELGVSARELLQADQAPEVQSLLDDLSRLDAADARSWTLSACRHWAPAC